MKKLLFKIDGTTSMLQEGTFMVPRACEGITLKHNIKQNIAMACIVLLYDSENRLRFHKQLGYSGQIISLGKISMNTTIGGIPGEIPEGEWRIRFLCYKAYSVNDCRCMDSDVIFEISYEPTNVKESIGENVWTNLQFEYENYDYDKIYGETTGCYKGDFHTHTQLSDGKELSHTVTTKCLADGLDFYVATEHNAVHTGWCESKLLVMPGMEITTELGHANIFGLTKRPESVDEVLLSENEEQQLKALKDCVKECKKNKWLLSINHPFLHVWKWHYKSIKLEDVSCLEIVNDPTYAAVKEGHAKEANEKAIELSDILWSQGYRICAIGGSDSHMKKGECYEGSELPSTPGDPATWLKMPCLTANNVLEALKKCNAYVSRFCEVCPTFRAVCSEEKQIRDYFFGDQIPQDSSEILFQLKITSEVRPICFYIKDWNRVDLHATQISQNEYVFSGRIDVSSEEYQWIRFGAMTEQGEFMFYANPITKGEKEPEIRSFKEAENMMRL